MVSTALGKISVVSLNAAEAKVLPLLFSPSEGVKFLLMFYCMTLRNYASARLFAQDHRNDILVNSLGLITGILGSRIASWIDPVGSILVALVILRSWVSTLIGKNEIQICRVLPCTK